MEVGSGRIGRWLITLLTSALALSAEQVGAQSQGAPRTSGGTRPSANTRPATGPRAPFTKPPANAKPTGTPRTTGAKPGGTQRATNAPKPPAVPAESGEAQWIWAPTVKDQEIAGSCYFRRTVEASAIESARMQVACDDRFELFVNGRAVGTGDDWKVMQSFDIQPFMVDGRNVIAVRAQNSTSESAGLCARLVVRRRGHTDVSYSSDANWKVATKEFPNWEKVRFNDANWVAARSFGELGIARPWGDEVRAPDGSPVKRFAAADGFRVERVIAPQDAGSLLAMTFNEWGEVLASREKGPLLLIVDKNKDGIPETVTTYCDKVIGSQGILALNGDVFVVGEGPDGAAFYRLTDTDQDGKADEVKALLKFEKAVAEHGPHAATLGPDGLIYLMIGNHSSIKAEFDSRSPYQHPYEGDVVSPKYEDPGGHAAGIKAPCGTVVRTDSEGSFVELVAGGFRNSYDLAFNREGELFATDSDMEWDEGMPWYRETRLYHVVNGGEYGSRSGWSVWPEHFLDVLPPAADTGRGSPTGIEVYNHTSYPTRYHNAVFACDWSQGRIVVLRPKPAGGSYAATPEVFLEGRPLNVTDIAVGPDGWLYFSTGGRGTDGGVYRIVYTGKVPPTPKSTGIVQAIRQPQLNSAWARQSVAAVQEQLGGEWGRQLTLVAEDQANKPEDRTRAIDLMQLYGVRAATSVLVKLTRDKQPEVRAKTAWLLGLHPDKTAAPALTKLLADRDPLVRRMAVEALSRGGYDLPVDEVVLLLGDEARFVAFAARRALERLPAGQWKQLVLESKETGVFLTGAVGLLVSDPQRATADDIVAHGREMLRGYLSDPDFIGLLRVFQLALVQGKIPAESAIDLSRDLAKEYPTVEPRMNRELVRLLAYLDESSALDRVLGELSGKAPLPEKMQAALFARFFKSGWTTEKKMTLLEFYEQARSLPDTGHSFGGYIENVSRDFFATFSSEERLQVLKQGERWPAAALSVLGVIGEKAPPEIVEALIELDGKLQDSTSDTIRKLQMGIAAVLGESVNPQAFAYLRKLFEEQPDRRAYVAMSLAQQPDGENFKMVVRALPILEGPAAQEVLIQLSKSPRITEDPEHARQVILCGLKLGDTGAMLAIKVLEKWTSSQLDQPNVTWDVALAAWQRWFVETYPDAPAPILPTESETTKWTTDEVLTYLTSEAAAHADASRGAAILEKAQCLKCHKYDNRGDTVGPDLSSVAMRFQKREILESILFPSQNISDQYSSKSITTKGGLTYTGLIGDAGDDAIVVLQANGTKTTIKKDDVEEIHHSKKSAMPEGLLNELSLEEIADLFAHLSTKPSSATAKKPSPQATKR